MSELGTRIQRLRTDVHLGVEECASQIGADPREVNEFETGARIPHLGEVAALAEVLGCFVSTILNRSELLDRTVVAARLDSTEETNNSAEVAEQLGYYLELDDRLTRAGVKAA